MGHVDYQNMPELPEGHRWAVERPMERNKLMVRLLGPHDHPIFSSSVQLDEVTDEGHLLMLVMHAAWSIYNGWKHEENLDRWIANAAWERKWQ